MTFRTLFFALLLAASLPPIAHAASSGRHLFANSTSAIDGTPRHSRARIARSALSATEQGEPMEIVVSLTMRNYAELEARLQSGEQISQAEMEEKYLPLASEQARVAAWLRQQGLSESLVDSNHTNIFVHGDVALLGRVFGVTFARVVTDEGEFTSAVTAPSLPADLSSSILGITGLQQHVRGHAHAAPPALTNVGGYPVPGDVAAAYNVPANLTGAGQTIALYGKSTVSMTDLASFWSAVGSTQTTSHVVQVNGTAGSNAPAGDVFEAMMDTEWTGAMAPGAKVRIYNEANAESSSSLLAAVNQVLNDRKTDASISVMSISYGGHESLFSAATLLSYSQTFSQLAAAGVTCVASSGDGGSNPRQDGVLGYSASAPLETEYPASDPNVTGVGGSQILFDASWAAPSEVAFHDTNPVGGAVLGTGGGYSRVFPRPSWQASASSNLLSAATYRCVPDIAAPAAWSTSYQGFYVVYAGGVIGGTGTSLSAPIWAGLTALINQAMTTGGRGPIGLLSPLLYPLAGSSSFNAITSGNNGAYTAGPIYNLCTGLGSPNLTNLIPILLQSPLIVTQPVAEQEVNAGATLQLAAVANGTAPLTYRWQILAAGTASWMNLSDSGTFSGTGTPSLTIAGASAVLSGAQFQCVVSNAYNRVSTLPSALVVNTPLNVTTLAGSGTQGAIDGNGTAAKFSLVFGLAVDGSGNVYAADWGANTIRKVSPDGTVTTLAGKAGVAGTVDGPTTVALFNKPWGIALDAAGNLYVADAGNHTIRKIATDGTVSTIAGLAGVSGVADGAAASARFNQPRGVAVDAAGTLYVSDTVNHTIRKIVAGTVTTLAGNSGINGSADGAGTAASFSAPQAIVVDASGTLYVADVADENIRKITAAGVVTTLAGTAPVTGSTDGLDFNALFSAPSGLGLDAAGNLYVADRDNNLVRKIAPSGEVSTPAGSRPVPPATSSGSADGLGSAAGFYNPTAIAVDAAGAVYVADSLNYSIRKAQLFPAGALALKLQPVSQTIIAGGTAAFVAAATGTSAVSYQWQKNDVAIPGATTSTLLLANTGPADAASYTCTVTDLSGSLVTRPATLALTTTSDPGRLINLSVLSVVPDRLTMGFVLGGNGTVGPENLLIRATGPALGAPPFNIPGVMIDPTLTVVKQAGSVTIATNSGWGATSQNQSQVTTADSAVGAFALTNPSSLDSALVTALPVSGGGYTATVAGKSGDSGYALTEVYDATAAGTYTIATPRLVNLSCLTQIAPGGTLTVGFVVGGSSAKTVLVRVSGPTLAAAPFGIPETMTDPQLTLQPLSSATTILAANAAWGGDAQIASVAQSVGAFAFTSPTSKDSAAVVTLAPGVPYTVQANSASGGGGLVLVEIYEVP